MWSQNGLVDALELLSVFAVMSGMTMLQKLERTCRVLVCPCSRVFDVKLNGNVADVLLTVHSGLRAVQLQRGRHADV